MSAHGTFVWHDHYGHDLITAPPFYAALLGWDVRTLDLGADGPYPLASYDGDDIGGFLHFDGVASHWSGYLCVDDYDTTAVRWIEAGGTIRYALGDVPNFGRVGLVTTPAGAEVALIQPASPREMPPTPRTGCFGAAVLEVPDVNAEAGFMRTVLGLQLENDPGGPTLCAGAHPVARVVTSEGPARFVHVLSVRDADEAHARALALGATDAGRGLDGGRRIVDPDGALVGLRSLNG